MRTDQHTLGYLGRALSLEFSAVQLYATQARVVETWGLSEAAQKLRSEANEEMGHAERIITRMLAHGMAPNSSQLRPVKLANTLSELLLINHSFEQELIQLYTSAVQHCTHVNLYDNRIFFQALLEEEHEHAKALTRWLASLEM